VHIRPRLHDISGLLAAWRLGGVLGRLGSCLVARVLAVASMCRASPMHDRSGVRHNGRRVKSKATRRAERVHDDCCCMKGGKRTQSCRN
jgi:hypothetical protein